MVDLFVYLVYGKNYTNFDKILIFSSGLKYTKYFSVIILIFMSNF